MRKDIHIAATLRDYILYAGSMSHIGRCRACTAASKFHLAPQVAHTAHGQDEVWRYRPMINRRKLYTPTRHPNPKWHGNIDPDKLTQMEKHMENGMEAGGF